VHAVDLFVVSSESVQTLASEKRHQHIFHWQKDLETYQTRTFLVFYFSTVILTHGAANNK